MSLSNFKSNIFVTKEISQAFDLFFIPDVHVGLFPIFNKSQKHQWIPVNLIPCTKVSIQVVRL